MVTIKHYHLRYWFYQSRTGHTVTVVSTLYNTSVIKKSSGDNGRVVITQTVLIRVSFSKRDKGNGRLSILKIAPLVISYSRWKSHSDILNSPIDSESSSVRLKCIQRIMYIRWRLRVPTGTSDTVWKCFFYVKGTKIRGSYCYDYYRY